MIDTIFFLLVFFMVASLAMTRQDGMPVNLPRAQAGNRMVDEHVVITIDRRGTLYLGKRVVSMERLARDLRSKRQENPAVVAVISADEDIVWGRGINVMDEVKKAGIKRVAIAVQPVAKEPR